MEKMFSRSQELIMSVLDDGKKRTYEELTDETGLSYDGIRGRISELIQMGVNIHRLREGRTTVVKLEKNKTKKRNLTRPRRYADVVAERLKTIDDFNGIAEFLYDIRENLPETSFQIESFTGNTVPVLLLSDLHFGEIIKDEHGNVIYDTETAEERMEDLFDNVVSIMEERELDTIHICMLGDMVDGDSIYRNHLFRVEKAAIDQVKDVVRSVVENVNKLTNLGYSVLVDAVRGNHGITNYKNLEEDNWDNVVYDMLDLVFRDNEDVEFNHFQTDQAKINVLDRDVVLYHGERLGDQIKTASGLRNFRGICGRHKLQERDIVCVGHLHEFGIESDQGKYLIRNGGLPDASEYAIKLNLFSKPEQTLLILQEDADYPEIIPIEV